MFIVKSFRLSNMTQCIDLKVKESTIQINRDINNILTIQMLTLKQMNP